MAFHFDSNDYEPTDRAEYSPLPYGWYEAKIKSAEMKFTKAGDGKLISVAFGLPQVTRIVWNNYNIDNRSAQAVKIGKEQLAQLCLAIGRPVISSEKDLEGGECSVLLAISSWQGKERNEVRAVRPLGGEPVGQQSGQRSVPAAAAKAFTDDDIPF